MQPDFYRIRPATKADALAMAQVKQITWEATYRGIYPDAKLDNYSIPDNIKKFEQLIETPDVDVWVAECNHQGKLFVCGYMSCGTPRYPFSRYNQDIGMLYILPDHQGKGLGRQLFEKARELIKGKGYNDFFVCCNKYNLPAQQFYLAMGGVLVKTDPDKEDRSVPQVIFTYVIED